MDDDIDKCLDKFKEERDAIQAKTFTKWVNKHLTKVSEQPIKDLFVELRDGNNLITLLEILTGDKLRRQRGYTRFHCLQNVQMALNYLKKNVNLVNISADDIVDGNQKLILGLIWTIISNYQFMDIISDIENISYREMLLNWAQKSTQGYSGVKITGFGQSWRSGLAFNAIIHRYRPDIIDFSACSGRTVRENLENALKLAEKELGITRLLDPEDVDSPLIDEKSLITYISLYYQRFQGPIESDCND